MRIEWLPVAIEGLQSQLGYLELRNPRAAILYSRRIEEAIGRLSDHPLSGRGGRKPGTRELVVARTPYVAIYRVEADSVVILRLVHGAQDWPNTP